MQPIIEDCTRGIVLLKVTTDRHDTSRGVTVTADLLVFLDYNTRIIV